MLVSALIGAFWEEVLFRGIGVEVFRSNGFAEGKAALWTSVSFGLVHVPAMVIDGEPFMLLVPLLAWITSLGYYYYYYYYYYYLARRWSGGLVLVIGSTGTHRGLERPWSDLRQHPAPRTPSRRVVLGAASHSHDSQGSR